MSDSETNMKKYLIEEYRANGGKRDDLETFPLSELMNEVRNQKEKKILLDQIDLLKANSGGKAPIKGISTTGTEPSTEPWIMDAYAFMGQYTVNANAINTDDPYHEHYKRDNEVIKSFAAGEGVILRDPKGRMA